MTAPIATIHRYNPSLQCVRIQVVPVTTMSLKHFNSGMTIGQAHYLLRFPLTLGVRSSLTCCYAIESHFLCLNEATTLSCSFLFVNPCLHFCSVQAQLTDCCFTARNPEGISPFNLPSLHPMRAVYESLANGRWGGRQPAHTSMWLKHSGGPAQHTHLSPSAAACSSSAAPSGSSTCAADVHPACASPTAPGAPSSAGPVPACSAAPASRGAEGGGSGTAGGGVGYAPCASGGCCGAGGEGCCGGPAGGAHWPAPNTPGVAGGAGTLQAGRQAGALSGRSCSCCERNGLGLDSGTEKWPGAWTLALRQALRVCSTGGACNQNFYGRY